MRGLAPVYVAALLLLALPACGPGGDTPPGAPAASAPPEEPAPDRAGEASAPDDPQTNADGFAATGGIELLMYDPRPTPDGVQRPLFEIQSPDVSFGEDGVVRFTDARALIRDPDAGDTVLTAGSGTFDRENQRAHLSGGVVMETGTRRIALEDAVWINEERLVRSENPASIREGPTTLEAGSFRFQQESDVLELTDVAGAIVFPGNDAAEPPPAATGPAAPPAFDRMTIERAPYVRMSGNRFDRIEGGMAIRLGGGEGSEPLTLAAEQAVFSYDNGGMLPRAVALEGDVRVEGALGAIASRAARFNLASRTFRFEDRVEGASPDVPRFAADVLTYAPGRIVLDGNAAVETPDGTLTADEARLDTEANTMEFAGAVRGSMAGLDDFAASRITYDADSADATLYDFTVADYALGAGAETSGGGPMQFERMSVTRAPRVAVTGGRVQRITGGMALRLEPAGDGDPMRIAADTATFAYAADGRMPARVSLDGDVRVDGGLGAIRSAEAAMDPAENRFEFAGGVTGSTPDIDRFSADSLTYSPEQTVLSGEVAVDHAEGRIRSERAVIDNATNQVEFTGAVRADTARTRNVRAERIVYDPASGRLMLFQSSGELDRTGQAGAQGGPRLKESDITDWVKLLTTLRDQGAKIEESPARRVVALLPPQVAVGIYRLSLRQAPNASARERLLSEFNTLLANPGLFTYESMLNVRLSAELNQTLREGLPADPDAARAINLRLLSAAFPESVRWRPESGDDAT